MVFAMPPTWASASKMMGVISDRRSSSSAAVKPAGPAPARTAIFCLVPVEFMASDLSGRAASYEQELAAGHEVPKKGKAGGATFGDKVVQSQGFDSESHDCGVDAEPYHADRREAGELDFSILEPPLLEHQCYGKRVDDA